VAQAVSLCKDSALHKGNNSDPRVATERYGATFVRSLPSRTIHQLPRAELFEAMKRFFAGQPSTP
jgi:hypothetical protein